MRGVGVSPPTPLTIKNQVVKANLLMQTLLKKTLQVLDPTRMLYA